MLSGLLVHEGLRKLKEGFLSSELNYGVGTKFSTEWESTQVRLRDEVGTKGSAVSWLIITHAEIVRAQDGRCSHLMSAGHPTLPTHTGALMNSLTMEQSQCA